MKCTMKKALRTFHSLLRPLFDPVRCLKNLVSYPRYINDILIYRKLTDRDVSEAWSYLPILDDRTATTGFDPHYVYLGAWAFRAIVNQSPKEHIDVGSQINWVTCLASITKVVFIDIRPFTGNVTNLSSVAGSVLQLPYGDQAVQSLSCLHVAEHIGLGRYGDPLNPAGTRQAIRELARVLSVGGHLYFALPVGKPKTCFNAHRIHDPLDIARWFAEEGLFLEAFAAVDDSGIFHRETSPADYCEANYACGMFHLVRT